MRLFVYGTLKRGQSRHHYLTGLEFVGEARTLPQYRLFNLGKYPGLVMVAEGSRIQGELWIVDEKRLELLDRVEGCDVGLYRRQPIELEPPNDDAATVAYFYNGPIDDCPDCGTRW